MTTYNLAAAAYYSLDLEKTYEKTLLGDTRFLKHDITD